MDSKDQLKNIGEVYVNGLINGNIGQFTDILKNLLLEAYIKGFKDASTLAYMKIYKTKKDET